MVERSRRWVRRWFERLFPERHVFVRTPDGEITGRVLTPRKQILLAASAAVLGGWCLLATGGLLLFKDELFAASTARARRSAPLGQPTRVSWSGVGSG